MTKHTPGPWDFRPYVHTETELEEIRQHKLTPVRMLTNDGEATVMAGTGDDRFPVARIICQTKFKRGEGYRTECETRDANARLTAASPELLKSLKRFASFAADNGWTDEEFHDSDGTGWISTMNAAIAKAEGEQ